MCPTPIGHYRHGARPVISIQFKLMKHENDAGYKLLFSAPELVRDLVLGNGCTDWITTRWKNSPAVMSRTTIGDVVWRVKVDDSWVY